MHRLSSFSSRLSRLCTLAHGSHVANNLAVLVQAYSTTHSRGASIPTIKAIVTADDLADNNTPLALQKQTTYTHLERLVVGSVLFCFLSHQAYVGNVPHGGWIEGAVLFAIKDHLLVHSGIAPV